MKKRRTKEEIKTNMDVDEFVSTLEDALYAAMLSSYAQGYHLIQEAAKENDWNIDIAEVSRIWEGGCIIRANILNVLHRAFEKANKDTHLFEIPELAQDLQKTIPHLRKIVALGVQNGIPVSGLSTALSYFDAITSNQVPANFIQGLRDYFGAHTYERTDKEGSFHTQWNN